MYQIMVICRRELGARFRSPRTYGVLAVFLAAVTALGFDIGGFLGSGDAGLDAFFRAQPWLDLVLIPAIGMGMWAQERRSGTLELLISLPITTIEAVAGKFLAAWLFFGLVLATTVPLWIALDVTGSMVEAPGWSFIAASYLASWLMAGGFLILSAIASALTRFESVAFVLGVAFGLPLVIGHLEPVRAALLGRLPPSARDALSGLRVLPDFAAGGGDVIAAETAVLFAALIGLGLFINAAVVDLVKSR